MPLFSRTTWCLLVLAWTCGASANWESLPAEVEKGMELWHVPGMAVAVVDSDNVRFQSGFGTTALEDGKPVDQHTLFAIASTTKAMVVAGILILADEGKLSLDDPVTRHIPELHFDNATLDLELNIRDLLAHRTGLPSTNGWSFMQGMPLDEQIRRLSLVEQQAPARSRLIYQNTMYELAGEIIERVSGQPWDEFLTKRLWHPIGMMETYGARGQIKRRESHVLPYNYLGGALQQVDWNFDADFADAAGSAWSSVHDMSLWAQFLLRGAVTANGERLISKDGLAEMFEPHQLASPGDFYPTVALTKPNWRTYGLGWFQQDFQGRMINFHTGSLAGLIAIIGLDIANDKAVIVLGNRDHAEMRHALLWYVMDETAPAEKRDWNQEIWDLYEESRLEAVARQEERKKSRLPDTKPALPLEAYAGTYTNDVAGDVTLRLVDGGLRLQTAMLELEMKHWHLDTFQIVFRDYDFLSFGTFNISPTGAVVSVSLSGQEYRRSADSQ